MQRPNTAKHWFAFSVAQYYEKYGTACRLRDLHPYVQDVFTNANALKGAAQSVRADGKIGSRRADMPHVVLGYYPTKITIEELRELGKPTEMPDGSPIPDGVDLTLPTSRVRKEEEDEVYIPTESETPSPFENNYPDDPASDDHRVAVADAPDADDTDGADEKYDHFSYYADNADDADEQEPDPEPLDWGWDELAASFTHISERAAEANISHVRRAYDTFAKMAEQRHHSVATSGDEAILTQELALMLLGTHPLDIDTEFIEDDDVRAHLEPADLSERVRNADSLKSPR